MAVSVNKLLSRQDDDCVGFAPVAAATILYQGTAVFQNVAGYAVADTGNGVNTFLGFVRSQVDNSGGVAGDKNVEYFRESAMDLPLVGVTLADLNKPVFATDNYTFTLTPASGAVFMGVLRAVVATDVGRVELVTEREGITVRQLSKTFVKSAMTAASATLTGDFDGQLPAGAIVLGTQIRTITGFTGDTSASAALGDGTTANRFTHNACNVLAAGLTGSNPLTSNNAFLAAAVTPRLTITTAATAANVAAGATCHATIYYIDPTAA